MELLQPQFQLAREPLVALLADRLEVHLVELGLLLEQLVARGAGKVVRAPGLVQGVHHVSLDDLREEKSRQSVYGARLNGGPQVE